MPRPRRRYTPIEGLESRVLLAANPLALSSLPGARATIHLDFDGHVAEGTRFNGYTSVASIVTPAFSVDSDLTTFSAADLAAMTEVWKRVAEDYAPFEVNVTTVDPGADALRFDHAYDYSYDTDGWGIRVSIGGSGSWYGGAGGVAWVGSFNWHDNTCAYVFSANLSSNPKYVAEAVSHEAGHSLGLAHDGTKTSEYYYGHGTGDTGWGPILGVGYGVNLTQWDDGTWPDAEWWPQDDLKVLTTENGFGYQTDDHGSTDAAATLLPWSDFAIAGTGLIERNTDLDVFAIDVAAAGTLTLNVDGAEVGPNLDVWAGLYDAAGNLVAEDNPLDGLDAAITTSVAAGRYYLRVDGIGRPATSGHPGYSDYGSLGRYTVSGTLAAGTPDPPPPPNGSGLQFDFGPATGPVAIGHARVVASDAYSAERGYGWLRAPYGDGDRGDDALTRDFAWGASPTATFAIDLADGNYRVTVTMGDSAFAHDYQGVHLEGELVEAVSSGRGEYVTRSYVVTVTDGQLTLDLADLGGSGAYWVLNGLTVESTTDTPPPPPPPGNGVLRFDFGSVVTPPDYAWVTSGMTYDADRGWGWLSGPAGDGDRGTDPLTRDFAWGTSRLSTFAVDLADGDYRVTVTLGDSAYAHDRQGIYLNGELVGSVDTGIGEYVTRTYSVTVTGGRLTLGLADLGGAGAYWTLNSLTIERAATGLAALSADDATSLLNELLT